MSLGLKYVIKSEMKNGRAVHLYGTVERCVFQSIDDLRWPSNVVKTLEQYARLHEQILSNNSTIEKLEGIIII